MLSARPNTALVAAKMAPKTKYLIKKDEAGHNFTNKIRH